MLGVCTLLGPAPGLPWLCWSLARRRRGRHDARETGLWIAFGGVLAERQAEQARQAHMRAGAGADAVPPAAERAPAGAPAERGSAATPAAASAADGLERDLPSAGRGPGAGAGAPAGGTMVPMEEVVLNLALEEVRRSSEMGGMPYRCRPRPQP